MAVVNAVKADPSLGHRPLVRASDPGGSRAHAAGGRVPIPGQPLGKSAVGRAACLLPGLMLRYRGGLEAYVPVFLGFPLAGVVILIRGGHSLADARRDAVVVRGAAVRARPVLPRVRVAALLRSAPVGLRVLEAAREVHHEAGGPAAAGSPTGVPRAAIFAKRRGDRVFLKTTSSRPHL